MCSRDEARFAATRDGYARWFGDAEYELIRIPDARSMSEGYNRGVRQARGKFILFSHDDVELLCDDLSGKLAAHFEHFDVFGVAGTTKFAGPGWGGAGLPHLWG